MTELLPCPFCGAVPDAAYFAGEWFVGCRHPYMIGGMHNVAVSAPDRDEAVRIWNTRWVDDRLEDDLK